ncbi:zinc-binding dehydrogenase [Siccirubricoccus deserti]
MARIEPGERVLIHGGAGAVGLAALQVALAHGARVAATAGTPAKRAFLRAAGAELVLDSRDPGFADALRAHWPDGVDVVLNSLAGEAMERSLGLLRPFGRFIELGKRDFAEGAGCRCARCVATPPGSRWMWTSCRAPVRSMPHGCWPASPTGSPPAASARCRPSNTPPPRWRPPSVRSRPAAISVSW